MCGESRVSSAVGLAAVQTARDLKAKAIVTPTFGGRTAILISNFRPEAPIYAVTPNDTILHRLQLVWGVTPLKGYEKDSTEHIKMCIRDRTWIYPEPGLAVSMPKMLSL